MVKRYRKVILVIEDEESLRELLAEELKQEEYDVVTAVNGQEGLQKLQDTEADLIICDRAMPMMTGYELLDRIRGVYPQYKDIPFIFLTALTDSRDKKTVASLKPYAYLEKPLDFNKLLKTIDTALSG